MTNRFTSFIFFLIAILIISSPSAILISASTNKVYHDGICECRCCVDSSLLGVYSSSPTAVRSPRTNSSGGSPSSSSSNQVCFPIGISTPGSISNLYNEITSSSSSSSTEVPNSSQHDERNSRLDFLLFRAFRKLLSLSWYADPDKLSSAKFKEGLIWLPSCSVNGLSRASNKMFYETTNGVNNRSVMRTAIAKDRLSRQAKRCLELASYLTTTTKSTSTSSKISEAGDSSSQNVGGNANAAVSQLFSSALGRLETTSDLVSMKKGCSTVQFSTKWVPDWIPSSSTTSSATKKPVYGSTTSSSSSIKLKRNPSAPFQTVSCVAFVFCICGYIFAAIRTTWFMKK